MDFFLCVLLEGTTMYEPIYYIYIYIYMYIYISDGTCLTTLTLTSPKNRVEGSRLTTDDTADGRFA